MIEPVLLTVPLSKITEYQRYIDENIMYPTHDAGDVIETFTADFGNGIEADIKVCNRYPNITLGSRSKEPVS